MNKFGISIELVAAIAGDGLRMVVSICFEVLSAMATAKYERMTRTVVSPQPSLLDLLYEFADYELLFALLRHSSDDAESMRARGFWVWNVVASC